MEHNNRKSHLLGLMQTEHSKLEALLNSLNEEQMLRPDVVGTWWEQTMISEIVHSVELDPGLNGEP